MATPIITFEDAAIFCPRNVYADGIKIGRVYAPRAARKATFKVNDNGLIRGFDNCTAVSIFEIRKILFN